MTATIPDEKNTPLDLRATTGKEFRELLGRVRATSGLSGGQIAAKTGMPRSTAYALTNTSRAGLPSRRDQVRAYVVACGLSDTQVDNVMDLWTTLHNEQDNTRNPDLADEDHLPWYRRNTGVAALELARIAETEGPVPPALMSGHDTWVTTACDHSPKRTTTVLDLAHFVLAREDRYQRALTLIKLLIVMVSVFVAGAVTIAVLVPSTATFIGTGLVASLLAVTFALTSNRSIRPKRPRNTSSKR